MSGIGFSEFLILCVIGLIVLGPKRLPQVARQIGSWVGQARRMTRVMKRQLEEELDFEEELNIKPAIKAPSHPPPRDDDTYSPLHEQPAPRVAGIDLSDTGAEEERDEFDVEPDFDDDATATATTTDDKKKPAEEPPAEEATDERRSDA